jgi:hypothetical protein
MAGLPVKGVVFFRVEQDFKNCSVKLKFKGKEYSKKLKLF